MTYKEAWQNIGLQLEFLHNMFSDRIWINAFYAIWFRSEEQRKCAASPMTYKEAWQNIGIQLEVLFNLFPKQVWLDTIYSIWHKMDKQIQK